MRKFGMSRIKFRELAHQGLIPGVKKQVGKRRKYHGSASKKTSKAKKRLRRTHQTVVKPEISFDRANGDYRRSHHVSLKGYYNGKKVIKGASK